MPSDDLDGVLAVINDLARKAAGGDYIFRGETNKDHTKVSSSLYRELPGLLRGQVEAVQQARLLDARGFTAENDEFEILTELQHYGGKTNLIDFTSDCLIALFFACDGSHSQAGRVILLERSAAIEDYIQEPSRPVNRVIAQKSIFVRPPAGFIEPDAVVGIPAHLKAPLLSYLRRCHGISAETIYNDLHGYIRYAAIHQEAFARLSAAQACLNREDYQGAIEGFNQSLALNPQLVEAYSGRGVAYWSLGDIDCAIADFDHAIALDPDYALAYGNRGLAHLNEGEIDTAIQVLTQAIDLNTQDARVYNNRGVAHFRKGEIDLAIRDYANAITLDPHLAVAYYNLGTVYLQISQWEAAKDNMTAAQNMGFAIVAQFLETYDNVAAFEQQHGIQVPPDLAEMLGG